jgi:hypothetical protein
MCGSDLDCIPIDRISPDAAAIDRLASRLATVMAWSDPGDPPRTWEALSDPLRDRVRYWVRDLLDKMG